MINDLHGFIPALAGNVAIITGGHTGLGFGTSIELAKHGARVYIASRSEAKFKDAKRDIIAEHPEADIRLLKLDLADLDSVREAAEWFSHQELSLHLLINNAGVMCVPYEETKEGFEMQVAVNYIGHFLFTELLLPMLQRTIEKADKGSVRIVNVSSDGHAKLAPKEGIVFSDMNMKNFSVWARYGHSKLANVLHAKELAKRYPDILTFSLHPGTVKTNLSAGPISSTPLYRLIKPLVELGAPGPRKGAANILFAAVSPSLKREADNGAYLLPVGKVSAPSKAGSDAKMAENLWDWTVNALRSRGY
ncbi:retinol dehydrogenase [Penicillium manginii]|uniref:retinol dehydrogenase n=1 Tax=Penicillium manginii TaxID=203109 RepID=UPI00254961AD|nr:retinol dehydrogenase [Penicillium manginii]XP_056955718.1 retinol dehydrogenase [Penicillium manginii]KAJ5733297.1 retinol dehydrogenase [Penicillium manginii]KAJ5742281.1 retinol dehydrogenase [Penicillium manginii]